MSASPKRSSTFERPASRSGQLLLERRVELDRVHLCDPVCEIRGQHAEPGPDLEHDVVAVELGEAADHAEDVLVDQEVLAELLLRPNAHGRPNASRRVRIDLRAECFRVFPARFGESRDGMDDVGRLVRLPSDRLRREVGAVRLREEPLGRNGTRRDTQVVRVLVGDVAGERDVPALLDRLVEKRDRREAVQHDRPVEPLPEDGDGVLVRRAVVDHDGQLRLLREAELVDEQLRLRVARRVVAVVVEADLAEPDDLRVAEEPRREPRDRT